MTKFKIFSDKEIKALKEIAEERINAPQDSCMTDEKNPSLKSSGSHKTNFQQREGRPAGALRSETPEDYLDRAFPKGQTLFRGEAMALLALTKIDTINNVKKLIQENINELGKIARQKNEGSRSYEKKFLAIATLIELKNRLGEI